MDDRTEKESLRERVAGAKEQFTSSADMLRDAWAELQVGVEQVGAADSLESGLETAAEFEFESGLLESAQDVIPYERIEETLRGAPRPRDTPRTPPRRPRRAGRRFDTSNLPQVPDFPQLPELTDFLKTRARRIGRVFAILLGVLALFAFLSALFAAFDEESDLPAPTTSIDPVTTTAAAAPSGPAAEDVLQTFDGKWRGTGVNGSTITLQIASDGSTVILRDGRSLPCKNAFGEHSTAVATGSAIVAGDRLFVRATLTCNLGSGRRVPDGWRDREIVFELDRTAMTLDGLDTCFHRPDDPAACGT